MRKTKMNDAEQWLADLEAKAQEAEQGEWKAITKEFFGDVSSDVEVNNGTVAYDLNPDDAAFIAAANSPDVVIATIDELLRLRAECARLEREANWLAGYLTIWAHESYDVARRLWRDASRKAVEEA